MADTNGPGIGQTLKRTAQFPFQKRATSTKKKQFIVDCIEASINLAYNSDSSLVQTKRTMTTNYNLRADILDERDVEQAVNPWGIKGATFPAKMQNYPIANPKIDLLIGEEYKRRFDWRVTVVNPDAISEKEETQRATIENLIMQAIEAQDYDEQQLEQEIQKQAKWNKYETQDLRERRASQYLNYLWKEQDLQIKFNRGFEDALVAGQEIYNIDIVGGEPVVRKVDPLALTIIRTGESYHIEDADIIIEDTYQPMRWVIDNYYDYLKPEEIDAIEKGVVMRSKNSDMIHYDTWRPPVNPIGTVGDLSGEQGRDWDYALFDPDNYSTRNIAAWNDNGEVRVVKCVWASMRKVGEKSWYDEEGELQKELVDEHYTANEELGETIEWFWITEWWEGTRIAENIYVKWGPRPVQFRSMGNKSAGGSGYVGTIYNTNTSQSRSLMDRMKPYQYLYNVFMYRTELAFAKSKGKISVLDTSRIPDGWDMDKWMYYAEILGWAIEDPFKEGNKGAATGKLAGQMNQNSKVLDLEMGSYIQQHVMMLDFIKRELGEIAGVTAQREGQISNRETVGGVERAVTQSSHITEKWFMMHDNTKLRVLETLLETAKYAWRNKKEKLQYITDEMSSVITEIDGQQFNEADYGIMVSNSTNDQELIQAMKQMAQAGLQNDKINFSGLMDIYLSDSMSSIRRKIETYEEESIQREQQNQEQQLQAQQQAVQAQSQDKQADRETDMQKTLVDVEGKITVAQIQSDTAMNNPAVAVKGRETIEKLKKDWEEMNKKYALENKKHSETVRHNKATEVIDNKKAMQKPAKSTK